jgi:enterochelin esterase-like enzyme
MVKESLISLCHRTYNPSKDKFHAEDYAYAFNKRVHMVWLGIGTEESERFYNGVKNYRDTLENVGIKTVFFESQGTDHEWQTWRRSLYGFAQLIFQD